MCCFSKVINSSRIGFLLSPERFSVFCSCFSSSLSMIALLKADSLWLLSELSGFSSLQLLRLQQQKLYSATLTGLVLHGSVPQPSKRGAQSPCRSWSFMLQMIPFKYMGSIPLCWSLDDAQVFHWLPLTFLWEIMVLRLGCTLESSGELHDTLMSGCHPHRF